jgi:hypothetical protein
VIANVLLDEAVTVMAANHWVGEVHIFDFGLQLTPIVLADPTAEYHCDLVGLPDCSIGIEQTLAEPIDSCSASEDEVVAMLDLREEQPMLAAGLFPFSCAKERGEARKPLLAATQEIRRGERVSELLEASGCCASGEGISTLLEIDAFLAHSVCQPVMLIEADSGGEWKIRTNIRPHCRSLI